MFVAAAKSGYLQDDFSKVLPRVQEIPFDSERKRMTTIHRNDGMGALPSGFAYPPLVAVVKGAPDVVLEICSSMQEDGKSVALEVIEALKVAKGAGLRTVMVTGDYKDTAEAIARDIGLLTPNGRVLTGAEIDRLSDEELAVLYLAMQRYPGRHKSRHDHHHEQADQALAIAD